jgi:hypothetical protein
MSDVPDANQDAQREFLHSAAVTIAAVERPVHLYYFGDFDPSGLDISRTVQRGIGEMLNRVAPPVGDPFAMLADIMGWDDEDEDQHRFAFTRVAVTMHDLKALMGHSTIRTTETYYLAAGDVSEKVKAAFGAVALAAG